MSLVTCPPLGTLVPGSLSPLLCTVLPGSSSTSRLARLESTFADLLANYLKMTPVELHQSSDFLSVLELAAELNTPLHSGIAVASETLDFVTPCNSLSTDLSHSSNSIVHDSLVFTDTHVFGQPAHLLSYSSLDLEVSDSISPVDGNPEHMSLTPIVSGSRSSSHSTPDGLYLSSMCVSTPDIIIEHVISSPACVSPTVLNAVTFTCHLPDGGPCSKLGQLSEEGDKVKTSLPSRVLEDSLSPPPLPPEPMRGRDALGEDEEKATSLPLSHQKPHLTEGNGREVTVGCRVSSLVVDGDNRQLPPSSSSYPLCSSLLDGHGLFQQSPVSAPNSTSMCSLEPTLVVNCDLRQSPACNPSSPSGWHSSLLVGLGLDPSLFTVSMAPSCPVVSNIDFPPLSRDIKPVISLPSNSKWIKPPNLPPPIMQSVDVLTAKSRMMSFICPRRTRSYVSQCSKRNLLLEVMSLTVPPLPKSRCLRLRGGGVSSVPSRRVRAVKKPLPSLPPHPPLCNLVPLPIPQLPGMNMAVADSTLPIEELGLFTLTSTDTDELLCLYSGKKIRDISTITDESPRFDYVWSNRNQTLIIDAYLRLSCFGRYANDALFEHRCNAIIEERNGKVYLISTRPLAANEEIFVNYGAGYWADRFHKFSPSFQQSLINAYHLVILPDGTVLTPKEAKRSHVLPSLPSIPPVPNRPIPDAKLDVLFDTFGSSKHLSLSLAFDPLSGPALMHQLMTSILSNPITSSVGILKRYLREYNSEVKLQLWLKQDKKHYGACVANGSCGFHFLYQMYLRNLRSANGDTLDVFPDLLSPDTTVRFRSFLEAILAKALTSPYSGRLSVVTRLKDYLNWLDMPLPRPPIPVWDGWMDAGSVVSLAEPDYPFSLAASENEVPHPYISDLWILVWSDTKLSPSGYDPDFTLDQLEEMLLRNNFGVLANSHFYPWPSLASPLGELDLVLLSLAKNLRLHYSAAKLPSSLIKRTDTFNGSVVSIPRAYNLANPQEDHTNQSASTESSAPEFYPSTVCVIPGMSLLSSSTVHEPISLSKLEILVDTFGMTDDACLSLDMDSTDPRTLPQMQHLMTSLLAAPPSLVGETLKQFFRDFPSERLRLWKPLNSDLYYTCVPDGSCGYQFLYQMYLRSRRPSLGTVYEDFPVLLRSPESTLAFRTFLEALIANIDIVKSPNLDEVVSKIHKYIDWIDKPPRLRGSTFEPWLSVEEVRQMADPLSNFSLAGSDPTVAFPVISNQWCYVHADSEFPNKKAGGFTLPQLVALFGRDNFGIMTKQHFFPLPPSCSDPITCLDRVFISLAERLILHWGSTVTPLRLVQLMDSSPRVDPSCAVAATLRPRAYHILPSGEPIIYAPNPVSDLSHVDDPVVMLPVFDGLGSSVTDLTEEAIHLEDSSELSTFPSKSSPSSVPSTLSKSELRLPWNNPLWGASKSSYSSLLSGVSIHQASKPFRSKKQQHSKRKGSSFSPLVRLNPPSSPNTNKVKLKNKRRRGWKDPAPPLPTVSFEDTYVGIHDDPALLGIVHHPAISESDINICTLNVNSLSDSKLTCILAFMFHLKIDVFVLTDTRHRESSSKHYTTRVKELLGIHTRCIHSPIAPHKTSKGFQSSVGGQLIIISHTWAGAFTDSFSDPSGLGLVSGVRLSTGAGSLLVMGTYWPFPSTKDNSREQQGLWASASRFLLRKKIKKNPKEYIQDLLCRFSDRHISKSATNITIVCGDLNHRWDNGKYQFQDWATSNNWSCPSIAHSSSSNTPIFTYTTKGEGCSWIDHHLIAPASSEHLVRYTTSSDGPFWDEVTDHRPILIHLSLAGGRGSAGIIGTPYPIIYHPEPQTIVDSNNEPLVLLYQQDLVEYLLALLTCLLH